MRLEDVLVKIIGAIRTCEKIIGAIFSVLKASDCAERGAFDSVSSNARSFLLATDIKIPLTLSMAI